MSSGVSLMGGLGNQIFQFAFALYLKKEGISIDKLVTNFEEDTFGRSLELSEKEWSGEFLDKKSFIASSTKPVIEINESTFARLHLNETKKMSAVYSLLFTGYWQDVEFLHKSSISEYLSIMPHRYSGAIALHIRRVDYIHHGLLPREYYESVLNLFPEMPFVVYTDEPNAFRFIYKNRKNFVGVSNDMSQLLSFETRQISILEEFKLMASHRIIVAANSSLSWAAAYLSHANHQGTVFYPSSWSLMYPTPTVKMVDWENWICIPTKLVGY